ncbi:MAG: hypothetical protein K6E28_09220 [Eubacterium sp.]|nr:hypothetical protein [Eubacterium sp.]
MNKAFKIVYIILFALVCSVPLIFMPFFKNDTSLEKRELAEFPVYMEDGKLNVDFSTQFEKWLNDRLPFRANVLSAANLIKGETLHTPTSNVIVGKDGYLYYESESSDYMDTNAMTDAEINAAAVTLSLMQENIEERGGRFLFVPMPNKASVYGEYMPDYYKKAEENNLSRIMERASALKVNYLDMQAVMEANKDKQLFHRRDSHWNYQGALIGYNAIMDGIGKEHKTYSDAAVTMRNDWRGDLDKLIYPAGGLMDDQYYIDAHYADFMFTYPMSPKSPEAQLQNFMSDREDGDDRIKSKNKELSDGSRLFMARDSFGRALLPFMIDNYEEAEFRRTDCPDINSVEDGTDFIYEIVERNLNRISEKAPFMYAPERDSINIDDCEKSDGISMFYDVAGYGVRIYGELPEKEVTGDGRVYIALEKDDDRTVYEAFPIYEKELIEKALNEKGIQEKTGTGFSMIIPREELSGKYTVSVISEGRSYAAGEIEVK